MAVTKGENCYDLIKALLQEQHLYNNTAVCSNSIEKTGGAQFSAVVYTAYLQDNTHDAYCT